MSETKFTPGPWRIYPETDGTEICAVDNIKGLPIRQRIAHPIRGANWIANAALIAAAPGMYEALQDLIPLAASAMLKANRDGAEYNIADELEAANAALARARGEA